MVTLQRLRTIIDNEIHRHLPNAIELRMPGETLVLPVSSEAVANEILVRGVEEVELVNIGTSLIGEDFIYALSIEIK